MKIKLGFDPTAPDLHLGHLVLLSEAKKLQDKGNSIQIVIGTFTAKIGDPTGKNKTRPVLTDREIIENIELFEKQIFMILDNSWKTEIHHNDTWLDKINIFELTNIVTLQQISQRDDFKKRIKENIPISLSELLYPLLQGFDSVHLKSDMELGGEDQLFNLNMGRTLQEKFGQKPQEIKMFPLLVGLDGINKMSKSLNNHIALLEPPLDIFSKIMSISDELMMNWKIVFHIDFISIHPKEMKKELGCFILDLLKHDSNEIKKQWEEIHEQRSFDNIQIIKCTDKEIRLLNFLKNINMIESTSKGHQLISQKAIKINSEIITGDLIVNTLNAGVVIEVGKKKIFKLEF